MSLQEIESAVAQLCTEELHIFRAWFAKRDAQIWDDQFENDVKAGKLDRFADEARGASRTRS
jgi:hypothetical protein